MDGFAQNLFDALSGLGPQIAVLLISMVPIVELRLAIPIGCIAGLPFWQCFLLACIGNLLPVPIIYYLLRPVFAWLKRTRLFRNVTEKLERKILSQSEKVTRYEMLGLVLFVGIPLPGTGAWTGTGVAALLELKPKKTFISVVLGVLLAGLIVSFVSYGVSGIISIFAR